MIGTFELRPLISEARSLIKGSKLTTFLIFLVLLLGGSLIGFMATFVLTVDSFAWQVLMFALGVAGTAFSGGLIAIGLHRASHRPVSFRLFGEYLVHAPRLFALGLVVSGIEVLGDMLGIWGLIIVSLLLVPFSFAGYFIVDREESLSDALGGSFTIVKNNFGQILGTMLLGLGLGILSIITIGIASIWITPFFIILAGLIYRDTVGIQSLPSDAA